MWFLSMLAVMANLLYVYAGLPEEVKVRDLETAEYSINKEVIFYSWLALIAIINALVYVFNKSIAPDEGFRAWFTGLVISMNIFFIIAFSFIGLYNSNENFDFSRIGFVLYFGVGIVCVWLTSWPVILVIRKLSS